MGVLDVAAMPGPAAMAIAMSTGIEHSACLFTAGLAAWATLACAAVALGLLDVVSKLLGRRARSHEAPVG